MPKWNHEVLIPIRSKNDTLKITCFDEDVIMDSFVGQHVYSVSTIAKA
jgi:Ca2+-dependent lipid-binding protein